MDICSARLCGPGVCLGDVSVRNGMRPGIPSIGLVEVTTLAGSVYHLIKSLKEAYDQSQSGTGGHINSHEIISRQQL